MAGVNKVILLGHLGADPEVKTFEGDNAVANVNLATTESYKDKQGNKVDVTEWHSLEFWGAQAKIAGQYLKKGSQIYVEGKIKTESWEKDGEKKYRTKIRVSSMTMLGGPKDSAQQSAPQQSNAATPGSMAPQQSNEQANSFQPEEEDRLPF